MAFDLDNLGGLVSEVLRDTRVVEDPWGFGIKAVVLRADHPDWKKYELDVAADMPVSERYRRVTAEYLVPDEVAGFRKKKQLSKGEVRRQMVTKLSEKDEPTTEVEYIRSVKQGLAEILIKSLSIKGETTVRLDERHIDLTSAEGRAEFLDHTLFEFAENGETKTKAIPVYKRKADGELEQDSLGDPVENHLAGWNTGDAIAAMLLDEAREVAAFVEKRKGDALEPSEPTRIGSTEIGFPGSLRSVG
jgi:hypothetical protein